ncbi:MULTISPECIES: FMN reductase [Amycolatopsis]|uniref:FMN reductase n=1 Tax=Amycolatopsis thermalba TaxID=944492 RepID=A0ABY4P0C4_9PSEU|nr:MULTISPECIES: FMN reductase [Amycolatopsis]OXM65122.1 NADPH-dependent FMN reductase [Amycolatopsis sp. KNN50.9b]UQS25681.1 FMN reductase [Amycolatopsis thermalba]
MSRTLVVVSAGLSSPSSTRLLGDRLAQAAARETGAGVEVVELRDLAGDIANNLVTGFPSPKLAGAIETVTRADGLIVVTPIFNASYSGLFKSFFDVIEAGSLRGKPVLIAATAGTARHSLALEFALRPLFAYLRADVMPTAVFAAAEDWGSSDGPDGDLTARIERAAGELATAMGGRPAAAPTGEDEFVPFDQQLARLGITSSR